jgi:hypothetical protein
LPPAYAGGSARILHLTLFAVSSRRRFCLQLNATLELSATVEQHPTSHFSYLTSHIVRRQLFDDIMNAECAVTRIFPKRRSFPYIAQLSRNDVVFSIMRGFQVGCAFSEMTHISQIDLVCRAFSSRRRCSSLKLKAEHALGGRGMLWFENGEDRSSFSVFLKAYTVTVIGEDKQIC